MSIWHSNYKIEHVIALRDNALNKHLGIEFIEIGKDYLVAKMPVDDRTRQTRGILHGGASCVLAESLASIASNLCIDMTKQKAVGLEINASHIRPVSSGYVVGKTTPVSLGKSIHVWNIEIKNDAGKINCLSKLTTVIVNLKDQEIIENTALLKKIFKN